MSDFYSDDEIVDPDATLAHFDEGDVVIDRRWPEEGLFEIGFVEEIYESKGHMLVYIPHEGSIVMVPDASLPYIEVVGDSYYDRWVGCCKGKEDV
tara:strand:+ start:657 stop:941 length:285 start_codon:yes stop_codon:yes gene_type:complete